MKQDTKMDLLLTTLAKRQSEAPVEPIVDRVRKQLEQRKVQQRKVGARKPRRWGWVLGGFSAAALLVVWLTWPDPQPLQFDIAGESASVGDWVRASVETPVRFSNGASVLLSPGSRGRITETRSTGATMDIAQGRVIVAIPHQRGQDWAFLAGPFRVRVLGTRFNLSWNVEQEELELVLFDGSVEVQSPWHAPQRVVAGQTMRWTVPKDHPTPVFSESSEPPPAPSASVVPSSDASGTKAMPSPTKTEPRWQVLAAAGEYRKAFALAEASGFEQEMATASPAHLLLLGDTARYAGNVARARQCYQSLRQRFPGSPESSRAIFRLGVLDFPSASALSSFETFLRESPGDPLAPEALGRILEIHHKSGNASQAESVARRYLKQYPNGAHANLAKGVIGE